MSEATLPFSEASPKGISWKVFDGEGARVAEGKNDLRSFHLYLTIRSRDLPGIATSFSVRHHLEIHCNRFRSSSRSFALFTVTSLPDVCQG